MWGVTGLMGLVGTQGAQRGHWTWVLWKEKEQMVGGVREEAPGRDSKRVAPESLPGGPVGPTKKPPSICPRQKSPQLHPGLVKTPFKEWLRTQTLCQAPWVQIPNPTTH